VPIDQYSDQGFHMLSEIIDEYPHAVNDVVSSAVIDTGENEKCASTMFAWPERRLFRIDNAENAALSRLYVEKQASEVPPYVQQRCDDALDIYGVKLELSTKTAAAPSSDEYVLPHLRRMRVQTADDVKLAQELVLDGYKRLDPASRAVAGVQLSKFAVDHGVRLDPQILKFAGVTTCDSGVLRDWLEVRERLTEVPGVKVAFTRLAEYVADPFFTMGDRGELMKVADALQELDEEAGLVPYYDRRIPDPLLTVFNTDKIAGESIELGGRQVPIETLLQVPVEVYKDVLGDFLVDEFTDGPELNAEKMKVILPTVPLDLANVLISQLGV